MLCTFTLIASFSKITGGSSSSSLPNYYYTFDSATISGSTTSNQGSAGSYALTMSPNTTGFSSTGYKAGNGCFLGWTGGNLHYLYNNSMSIDTTNGFAICYWASASDNNTATYFSVGNTTNRGAFYVRTPAVPPQAPLNLFWNNGRLTCVDRYANVIVCTSC